jgi:hypothetical protein
MQRALAAPLVIVIASLLAGCSAGNPGGGASGPNLPDPGQPSPSVSPVVVASPASPSAPAVVASPAAVATTLPTPAPTKVPGTGKITMSKSGFAITLPAGWRQVPLDGSDISGIEDQLPAGSQMAAVLETDAATAAKKGFALLAVDLAADTIAAGTISTLEVEVTASQGLPLSLLEPLAIGLLEEAPGVTSVSGKIVTIAAGKAIRITYTLTPTTSSGQKVKLAATNYVLESSKHTYTITFACSYAAASACRADADAIMKTFDIL